MNKNGCQKTGSQKSPPPQYLPFLKVVSKRLHWSIPLNLDDVSALNSEKNEI